MPSYLTPKQDDSNQEPQVCIAEAGGQGRRSAAWMKRNYDEDPVVVQGRSVYRLRT